MNGWTSDKIQYSIRPERCPGDAAHKRWVGVWISSHAHVQNYLDKFLYEPAEDPGFVSRGLETINWDHPIMIGSVIYTGDVYATLFRTKPFDEALELSVIVARRRVGRAIAEKAFEVQEGMTYEQHLLKKYGIN